MPTKTKKKSKGALKKDAELAHIPLSRISAPRKFRLRSSTDGSSITELMSSIKTIGIIEPLVVRTTSSANRYELVCGYRRFGAARKLKIKEVPVAIREIPDDLDVISIAMSENSSDARTALSALDEAQVFSTMAEQLKNNLKEVAQRCGCSQQKVRKSIALLQAPKDIKEKLKKGSLSKMAALAVAELEDDVREAILPNLREGITEREVKLLANDYVRGQRKIGDLEKKAIRFAKDGGGGLSVIRPRSEIRATAERFAVTIIEADDDEDVEHLKWALAMALYCVGRIEEPDPETEDYDECYQEYVADYAPKTED